MGGGEALHRASGPQPVAQKDGPALVSTHSFSAPLGSGGRRAALSRCPGEQRRPQPVTTST